MDLAFREFLPIYFFLYRSKSERLKNASKTFLANEKNGALAEHSPSCGLKFCN